MLWRQLQSKKIQCPRDKFGSVSSGDVSACSPSSASFPDLGFVCVSAYVLAVVVGTERVRLLAFLRLLLRCMCVLTFIGTVLCTCIGSLGTSNAASSHRRSTTLQNPTSGMPHRTTIIGFKKRRTSEGNRSCRQMKLFVGPPTNPVVIEKVRVQRRLYEARDPNCMSNTQCLRDRANEQHAALASDKAFTHLATVGSGSP